MVVPHLNMLCLSIMVYSFPNDVCSTLRVTMQGRRRMVDFAHGRKVSRQSVHLDGYLGHFRCSYIPGILKEKVRLVILTSQKNHGINIRHRS